MTWNLVTLTRQYKNGNISQMPTMTRPLSTFTMAGVIRVRSAQSILTIDANGVQLSYTQASSGANIRRLKTIFARKTIAIGQS